MINFNVPPHVGKEEEYMHQAIMNRKICGDGPFTKKCSELLEERFHARKVLLTTSGTSALEMAALLCGFKQGDEVVLPSFTFSSTATAIVGTGATPIFVDIDPVTMNIDPARIEAAVNEKTKGIMVMHYAGISCDMDRIMEIAKNHGLKVIEDAAQAVMSSYRGKPLGTIGDFGCYSFHETKNYSMGEGGALVINNAEDVERAEIIREKGTNRSKYYRGQVDKYTWEDFGSSYLPSDLNAAYLLAQLEMMDEINANRLATWNAYMEAFEDYGRKGLIELPTVPDGCTHNAHMFYIKLRDINERTEFIDHMAEKGIMSVFHYIPLHSAPAGIRFGRFDGEDRYTTSESERLTRLPLYYDMDPNDRDKVIKEVCTFLETRGK